MACSPSNSNVLIPPSSSLTVTMHLSSAPNPKLADLPSSPTPSTATAVKPIIAIAGLAIETSTFSPLRTTQPSQFHPYRGSDIADKKYAAWLGEGTPLRAAADWRGALIGHALPGGVVTRPVFDSLTAEICVRLFEICEAGRAQGRAVEGLWFDIHGAMVVEGLKDAEAVLLRRIRTVVGPDVLVSASMDLHGNVSRELCHGVDLITGYRTAPHVDTDETKVRACWNLLHMIRGRREQGHRGKWKRPVKAWIPIPVLLPGEQTSTRVQPAKKLYEMVPQVEAMEGVIDASVWVGYAWADEERCRAVTVVTGWDKSAVKSGAERLAKLFWDVHEEFTFVAPVGSYKECIDSALRIKKECRPFYISDSGDNPTAGGSGDVTWGLTKLLEREEFRDEKGPVVIYASLPGPDAVKVALQAGVGATVTVTAGAEVDDLHSGPLELTGCVHAIKQGDPWAHTEVVLQVGSVYAILTEFRKPYHHEKDFTDLDLRPRDGADIVIVKIGYLEPELYDMAKGWMMALTPGSVDQDLERLGHKKISRPMWPFDKVFESQPDLRARVVPSSDEVDHEP